MKTNVRKSKKLKKYLVHALILFAVFSLVKVWQNVSMDQISRHNLGLNRELQGYKYEQAVLTDKYESLTHIDRVERLARERLGFKPAEKINIPLNSRKAE